MGLSPAFGRGVAAIDASVVIYFVERHPEYLPIVRPLFAAAAERHRDLVTSAVTLLEVLVVPLRAGDAALAARYETLLTGSPGLTLVEADRDQMRTAARLRARYGVRTPDALQLAAALATGSEVFVTNDRRVPALPELRVVQLRDLTPPP